MPDITLTNAQTAVTVTVSDTIASVIFTRVNPHLAVTNIGANAVTLALSADDPIANTDPGGTISQAANEIVLPAGETVVLERGVERFRHRASSGQTSVLTVVAGGG